MRVIEKIKDSKRLFLVILILVFIFSSISVYGHCWFYRYTNGIDVAALARKNGISYSIEYIEGQEVVHVKGGDCGKVTTLLKKGKSGSGSQLTLEQQTQLAIFEFILIKALESPKEDPMEAQRKLQQKMEEEARKKQEYAKIRDEISAELKRAPEDGNFEPKGVSDEKPFGFKGIDPSNAGLKEIPNSGEKIFIKGAWEQLNASKFLSECAEAAVLEGEYENASFLSHEAFQAANGNPIRFKIPPPPPKPEFTDAQWKVSTKLAGMKRKQIDVLIEAKKKLTESEKKVETIKQEKNNADVRLVEIKNSINQAATPEEKQVYENLLPEAEEAVVKAKENLNEAEKDFEKSNNIFQEEKQKLDSLNIAEEKVQKDPNYAQDVFTQFDD